MKLFNNKEINNTEIKEEEIKSLLNQSGAYCKMGSTMEIVDNPPEWWIDSIKNEKFKRVKGFENYIISSFGGLFNTIKMKWYHGRESSNGYLLFNYSQDGKSKTEYAHRLVAQSFLDNNDNLPEVNHIDEDKHNNRVDNLEWCTVEYNRNFGNRNKKISESLKGRNKKGETK